MQSNAFSSAATVKFSAVKRGLWRLCWAFKHMDEHRQTRTQKPAAVAFNHSIFLQVWRGVLQRDEARQMRVWSHFMFCIWLRITSPHLLQLSWDECCNTVLPWSSRNVHYKSSLYFSFGMVVSIMTFFFFFFFFFYIFVELLKGLCILYVFVRTDNSIWGWKQIRRKRFPLNLEIHTSGWKATLLRPWNVWLITRYILNGGSMLVPP